MKLTGYGNLQMAGTVITGYGNLQMADKLNSHLFMLNFRDLSAFRNFNRGFERLMLTLQCHKVLFIFFFRNKHLLKNIIHN